jgi:hypothetical protein
VRKEYGEPRENPCPQFILFHKSNTSASKNIFESAQILQDVCPFVKGSGEKK